MAAVIHRCLDPICQPQQEERQQKDDDRHGGAERPVECHAEQTPDQVRHHEGAVVAAEELGGEEVTHAQHEREGGSRQHTGQRQGQNDSQKGLPPVRIEVLARLLERDRDRLEHGVDRHQRKRSVDVGERQDHCPPAVEEERQRVIDQSGRLQQAVENPLLAQDDLPGVRANEVAHPERDDHRHVHELLVPPHLERQQIGQRIGEKQREEGDSQRDAGRKENRVGIEIGAEESAVVLQCELVRDRPTLEAPEGMHEQQDIGDEEQDGDESDGQRRRKHGPCLTPGQSDSVR